MCSWYIYINHKHIYIHVPKSWQHYLKCVPYRNQMPGRYCDSSCCNIGVCRKYHHIHTHLILNHIQLAHMAGFKDTMIGFLIFSAFSQDLLAKFIRAIFTLFVHYKVATLWHVCNETLSGTLLGALYYL